MRRIVLTALVFSLSPLLGAAQEAGSLLVATERMEDPRFSETVLLLLHHDGDGAIGIAINRPTWVSAEQLFPELRFLHDYRGTIFHGGPLAQANVLILSRGSESAEPQTERLLDDIYVSTNLEFLEQREDASNEDSLRFYAGHAGWGPGQLDEEIEAGSWRVVSASAGRVFTDEPRALWSELIASSIEMQADAASADGTAQVATKAQPLTEPRRR